ncbi:MAG TPA: hypothetical protein VF521_08205, partial [Pyrinomonadaceae bacterium]
MSYSSLEGGHAESAGAALYPLRTLAPDLIARAVRQLVEARENRAVGPALPPETSECDIREWLLSDDS